MGKSIMMNHRKTFLRLTVIAVAVGGLHTQARAQAAKPTPSAPAAAAPNAPAIPPDALPDVPVGEAGSGEADQTPSEAAPTSNLSGPPTRPTPPPTAAPSGPLVFPAAAAQVAKHHRVKPLQTTVGLDPTAPDFGAETDLVSTANEATSNVKPRRWTFVAHGYLRAPFRMSTSPASAPVGAAMASTDPHSPAHVVGSRNDDWNWVGLNPAPTSALYLSVGNSVVSGTLIISADTFIDSGYKQLNSSGGIAQGYVTMKWNEAFGDRGGLALTAGAFSNRYGLAGPHQQSSGYYNTYLFGRTHVVGAALTADIDLTEHAELILEAGGGSKLEVVPWLDKPLNTPYLPDQGPTPQGSDFVYHVHAALQIDDWARIAAHSMVSYTPNDLQSSTGGIGNAQSGHLYTYGLEGHLDSPRFGNAYLGYSRINAARVLSLADGIEVIHSPNGVGLTKNYFNPSLAYGPVPIGGVVTPILPGTMGDSGDVDTVLFQYMVRMSSLLELPSSGRDLTLALYGMFNRVSAPTLNGGQQDKFKGGAEVSFAAVRYLSLGARFDRVMPNGGSADVAYSALSPRLVFHTTWLSREYLLLSYTRYFLGSKPEIVATQYDPFSYVPDKNLLVFSALVTF
jgi:hypothetical protein